MTEVDLPNIPIRPVPLFNVGATAYKPFSEVTAEADCEPRPARTMSPLPERISAFVPSERPETALE